MLERLLLATRPSSLPEHLKMGDRGEIAALFHLRRQGYAVVARQWRTPRLRGDVDLIAWEGDTLCFVEVKTRGGRAVATAESAVDEDKRNTLRRIGRQYMKGVSPPAESVRFDVVSIYFEEGTRQLTLYRGAFGW
jgi:putative endonuclease